jgi:hypothetical protein
MNLNVGTQSPRSNSSPELATPKSQNQLLSGQ